MVVLVALVLLSIAAVGLIRMVDTGTLIVGNLAFKQSTTSAADRAGETAIAWLRNTSAATLEKKNAAVGYYATSLDALDVTGKSSNAARAVVDWNEDDCAYAAAGSFSACIKPTGENSVNGYSTRYLITRMCRAEGAPDDGNSCAKPVSRAGTPNPETGALEYPDYLREGKPPGPYFRIVARAVGPRNTVSFTETYVHF
jgi:hypothetical protein